VQGALLQGLGRAVRVCYKVHEKIMQVVGGGPCRGFEAITSRQLRGLEGTIMSTSFTNY